MRKSVKRAAIIAVSALLAMSMAGCAKKKDPKELYTEAIKKNQELSSMDMSSVVKMTMSQGEETIDVDVDMDIQMADVNTDKMKYVAKGSTSLMGQSIETSMFYTDGYYYMDMMGQKMKYAMDMDKLMEQVKQTTDNGNLNVEYMKDIQAKKDGVHGRRDAGYGYGSVHHQNRGGRSDSEQRRLLYQHEDDHGYGYDHAGRDHRPEDGDDRRGSRSG